VRGGSGVEEKMSGTDEPEEGEGKGGSRVTMRGGAIVEEGG